MALPYTSVSVSGYNSNPPADDGSQVEANRVKWATIKTKLPDPLKTAIESINSGLLTAFAKVVGGGGVTSTAISYTVVSGDQGKLVKVTASGVTITTPDATSVGSPFVFAVLNNSSGDITLDGNGSQTINGTASLTMAANDGWMVWTDGSNWFVTGRKTGVLPRGYLDGCVLSNGTDATNDINIAAGVCRDSTNAVDITVAAMAGKQLDANWAPGAAAGMRNSAAGITDTTYHIYAVATALGVQDIYAHTSTTVATVITALQAESGGSSYIYARRIGSILRESSAIVPFVQDGDLFDRKAPVANNSANPGTSAVTVTLSVPTGISVEARMSFGMTQATTSRCYVFCAPLDTTDAAASVSNADAAGGGGTSGSTWDIVAPKACRTNTSGQVRQRVSFSDANTTILTLTKGWIDRRGKDS